jgi:hypothetical protein
VPLTGGRAGAEVAGLTCGDAAGRTCGRAGAEDPDDADGADDAEPDGPEPDGLDPADGVEDCDGDADFNSPGTGDVVAVGRAPVGRTRVVASSLAPDVLAESSPESFDFTSAASVVIGAAPPPGL